MATGGIVQFRPTVAYNFEKITVSSSAIGLDSTKYRPTGQQMAETAFITIEDNSIRYRYDGTDPTTSTGHKATSGTTLVLRGEHQLAKFKMIAVASDAVAQVSYERE